jgi:hypothetical protein
VSDTEGTPESNSGTNEDGNNSGTTSTAGSEGFKPPATQEELNRIIADRVKRTEAKYAGFSDLKKKAEQFDAMTDAQKTELQRAQDRAEAAEKRAQALESAQQIADWKSKIAKDAGIPASALRGTTEEELQAHAAELKALLPDPTARHGAYVAGEGRTTKAAQSPAELFGEILTKARGQAR